MTHLWIPRLALGATLLGFTADSAVAQETLLLQQPAVSARHVVFVYANDLWVTGRGGGEARRLTSHVGTESGPRISPDGKTIVFASDRSGIPLSSQH